VITDIKTDPFIFQWSVDVAGHEWKKGTDSELHLFERGGFERKIRVYHPLRKSGLFIEFAALEPSRYAILQFANRYGDLFGSYSDGDVLVEGGRFKEGATLKTWKAEIEDMHALVRIWEAIKGLNKKELEAFITWAKGAVRYKITKRDSTLGVVLARPDFNEDLLKRFRPGDVLPPARYALQKEINKRIVRSPTVPRLVWCPGERPDDGTPPEPDHHQRLIFEPSDLLAAMWLQFAQAVTGEFQLKRCEACGDYFQVGRGGKRSDSRTCGDACRQKKRGPRVKRSTLERA
jgi:hypothetical protein